MTTPSDGISSSTPALPTPPQATGSTSTTPSSVATPSSDEQRAEHPITREDLRSGFFVTLESLDTIQTGLNPILSKILGRSIPTIPVINFRGLREGRPAETNAEIISNSAELLEGALRGFLPKGAPQAGGSTQGDFMLLLLDSTLLDRFDNHNDSFTAVSNPLIFDKDATGKASKQRTSLAVVLLLRGALDTINIEDIQRNLTAGQSCSADQINRYQEEHELSAGDDELSCDEFQQQNPSFIDWALENPADDQQLDGTSAQDPISTVKDSLERVGLSYEYASGLNFSVLALEAMEKEDGKFDWRPLAGAAALAALKFGLPYAQAAARDDEHVGQVMDGSDIGYAIGGVLLPLAEAMYTDNPDVMGFNLKFNGMFAFGRRDGMQLALSTTRNVAGISHNQLTRGDHVALAGLEMGTFTLGGVNYGIAMREGSTLERISMTGLSLIALGHLLGTSGQLAHEQKDGREMIHAGVSAGGFLLGAGLGAALPKNKFARFLTGLSFSPNITDGPTLPTRFRTSLDNPLAPSSSGGFGMHIGYSGTWGLTERQRRSQQMRAEIEEQEKQERETQTP